MQEISDHCDNPNIPKFLVALKSDIEEDEIDEKDIEALRDNLGFKEKISTSAQNGSQVKKLFNKVSKAI